MKNSVYLKQEVGNKLHSRSSAYDRTMYFQTALKVLKVMVSKSSRKLGPTTYSYVNLFRLFLHLSKRFPRGLSMLSLSLARVYFF